MNLSDQQIRPDDTNDEEEDGQQNSSSGTWSLPLEVSRNDIVN